MKKVLVLCTGNSCRSQIAKGYLRYFAGDNAKERCPYFPTKAKKFYQSFPDPAKATGTEEEISKQFRHVRHMIKAFSEKFVAENLNQNSFV